MRFNRRPFSRGIEILSHKNKHETVCFLRRMYSMYSITVAGNTASANRKKGYVRIIGIVKHNTCFLKSQVQFDAEIRQLFAVRRVQGMEGAVVL